MLEQIEIFKREARDMSLFEKKENEGAEVRPEKAVIVILGETLDGYFDEFLQKTVIFVFVLIVGMARVQIFGRLLYFVEQKSDDDLGEVFPAQILLVRIAMRAVEGLKQKVLQADLETLLLVFEHVFEQKFYVHLDDIYKIHRIVDAHENAHEFLERVYLVLLLRVQSEVMEVLEHH